MLTEKYTGGKTVTIEKVDIHLPPEGYVYNRMINKLDYTGVVSRSDKSKNQYWDIRDFQPKFNYKQRRKIEIAKQQDDPFYVDEELEEYREQEWYRRINGLWFMNNGVPTYISGLNYFFLVHWKLDVPTKFRIIDVEYFYFLQYCTDCPNCLGMIEITKRRQGKTVRAGCYLYDYTSRHRNAHGGIQSKTFADAKDNVYSKGVLNPFKYLPDFFVPTYDLEKGRLPKSGLFFQQTNVKGKGSLGNFNNDELDSSITYKPSEHVAYDGFKLHRYVGDEVGKCLPPIDVYKRHQIVQFCMMLDGEFIGKALYTTTVEEMEAGGVHCKELWEASDQTNLDQNSRTRSGLYRYFMPAYRTDNFDIYGFPDEEKNKEFYNNTREALRDDPAALASFIRKNPFTIEEAFWVDSDNCLFDSVKLQSRLMDIDWMEEKDLCYRGHLVWEGGERDTKVVFVPSASGHFLINKVFDPFNENLTNRVSIRGSQISPDDSRKVAGVDTFDHDKTVDNRRSNGAAYVVHKADATDDVLHMNFICQYLYRPQKAVLFYEDMLKMAVFFGCEMLIEDNKIGLINYLKHRGYNKFIAKFNGKEGISGSSATHPHIVEETMAYVVDYCDKVVYVDLLKDWLTFDINNTTKHDESMAAGYALIGANKLRYMSKKSKDVVLNDQ